jgi:hypothetical protein
VVSVAGAVSLAALQGLPETADGCAGETARMVAWAGAGWMALALAALVALRQRARGFAAAMVAAGAAGHAGLAAARPEELCGLCAAGLALALVAAAAAALWIRRDELARWGGGGAVAGALAGVLGLGAVVDSSHRVEVGPASAPGPLALHVVLKPGCPRCAEYLAADHAQVTAALPPGSSVATYELRMPGQLAPRAYPCLIVTAPGDAEPLARLDGLRDAARAVEAIRKLALRK